eukprot:scaffold143899_cov443-Phaeocystis_antarctica.AAC.1
MHAALLQLLTSSRRVKEISPTRESGTMLTQVSVYYFLLLDSLCRNPRRTESALLGFRQSRSATRHRPPSSLDVKARFTTRLAHGCRRSGKGLAVR